MRAQAFSTTKIVAFVDIGYSNFQAVIIQFTKEKFQVLQTEYDANLGGREFDRWANWWPYLDVPSVICHLARVIYKYLSRYFAEQYSLDVLDSTKAGLRLMTECEKIKKRLSANSGEFVVNIECLMNDKDVSAKIDRSLFEVDSLIAVIALVWSGHSIEPLWAPSQSDELGYPVDAGTISETE